MIGVNPVKFTARSSYVAIYFLNLSLVKNHIIPIAMLI